MQRRRFLTLSASATLLGFMPRLSYASQIREMRGKVWVNNRLATLDTPIKPGDTIKTGANSRVIFIIGDDVYKLGARSTLRLRYSGNRFVNAMRLISGTLLGVFGKGRKTIDSPTATLGIRGTGLFIKIEPNSTYFCTCYGETEIYTRGTQIRKQYMTATHHMAYSISHDAQNPRIYSDIMKDHTDDELYYLESLVGRKPPI
ncbi:MAG: hypothetical protein DRR08_10905 [Candidatus Parabeggiatoa sp. nov. 2]|nr:MAG: hypothetical protein B6247_12225 [Beggiatoa sp. 4572_84]RKZ60594.1 MAG: hypothetical protein DRR08_10905 [Gammaproteobacteria bacterium]HEC86216.1 hypothetical protein [Thioploca sp.]